MLKNLRPITKRCTEKILDQMNNTFHLNKENNKITCFFTKIKYKNIHIPVIISDYQIIDYISNDRINIYK